MPNADKNEYPRPIVLILTPGHRLDTSFPVRSDPARSARSAHPRLGLLIASNKQFGVFLTKGQRQRQRREEEASSGEEIGWPLQNIHVLYVYTDMGVCYTHD